MYKLSENSLKCYKDLNFYKLLLDDSNVSINDYKDIIKEKSFDDYEFSSYAVKKFLRKVINVNTNEIEQYF